MWSGGSTERSLGVAEGTATRIPETGEGQLAMVTDTRSSRAVPTREL